MSENKKLSLKWLWIITAAALVVAFAAVAMFLYFGDNRYNKEGYINTSGKTIADLAEENGLSVKEFKKKYNLPFDMGGDTNEAAAYYNMLVENVAEVNGSTFDDYKKMFGWGDEVTKKTTWYEALGETKLKYMYTSDNALEAFRKQYNLPDTVTGETKYKEIRDSISKDSGQTNNLEQIKP